MSVDMVVATSLDDYARTANEEHGLVLMAGLDLLQHAITCGEALVRARALVRPGDWTRWSAEYLGMSYAVASSYQRLAKNKDAVIASEATTMFAALAYLRSAGAEDGRRTYTGGATKQFDEGVARELRAQGMSYAKIAEAVGSSTAAVCDALDPKYRKMRTDATRRSRQRRKAERDALKAKERDALVKRTGGSPAEAYALLRRCASAIDRALADMPDNGGRRQMTEALSAVYAAEDAIVRALQAGRRS